jgi:hypothetical protein
MVPQLQLCQHGQDAVKKDNVVLVCGVVVAIALSKFWVFFNCHIRCGVRQGLHQSQPDDIRRSFFAGFLPSDINHSKLNATRDDGGGIKQRAIPIEGDQVKLAGT